MAAKIERGSLPQESNTNTMNSQLQKIIESLQGKAAVDAVLLTGSSGQKSLPYSDIDLVIILTENTPNIKALYTWLDGTFADIFFFDARDIKKLLDSASVPANDAALLASLYVWTKKGTIQFDKSGHLTKLQAKDLRLEVPAEQQAEAWQAMNYNYEANTRYYKSGDPLYQTALELRLLYSVSQLMTAYFMFRGLPWEGEKLALAYLQEHEPALYREFLQLVKSVNMDEKFAHYCAMVALVVTPDFPLWTRQEILPQPKGRSAMKQEAELTAFWKSLIS